MSGLWVVYRREVAGLFLAPLAWILFGLALVLNGLLFVYVLEEVTRGEVNTALSWCLGGGLLFWAVTMTLAPLLTMRMISEESRSGLLEFLLTAPVTDGAVVVGKALAVTTFFAFLWASVPLYAALVHALGAPPDWGVVLTGWIGTVLVSALFTAIGLVASALTSTPLLSAFLAFVANLVLYGASSLPRRASVDRTAARWLHEKVDVVAHYQGSFQLGALDSAHVVFYVAWIAALLFLAVRLVESRRWL